MFETAFSITIVYESSSFKHSGINSTYVPYRIGVEHLFYADANNNCKQRFYTGISYIIFHVHEFVTNVEGTKNINLDHYAIIMLKNTFCNKNHSFV